MDYSDGQSGAETHHISQLLDQARKQVESLSATSHVFNRSKERRVPRLRIEEIFLTEELGRGRFCVAIEVGSIKLKSIGKLHYEGEEEDRRVLQSRCHRKGEARYVVKMLGDEVKKGKGLVYVRGTIDMALETRFLSALDHPNIIRMRAVAECSPYDDCYFIVLDRLRCTLTQRIINWKRQHRHAKSLLSVLRGISRKKVNECFLQQLLVCYSICRAISYLHDQNIIHRDIKPENIGFDVRDDVKIFDFGFAKELHIEDRLSDGTFHLTGMTGSLRYMAPEVARSSTYNTSVDVYSFAIMFWEILALKTPFEFYTKEMHWDLVVNRGFRPLIDEKWGESLAMILSLSWSSAHLDRPSIKFIGESIRGEIERLVTVDGVSVDVHLDTSHRSAKSIDFRGGHHKVSPECD